MESEEVYPKLQGYNKKQVFTEFSEDEECYGQEGSDNSIVMKTKIMWRRVKTSMKISVMIEKTKMVNWLNLLISLFLPFRFGKRPAKKSEF